MKDIERRGEKIRYKIIVVLVKSWNSEFKKEEINIKEYRNRKISGDSLLILVGILRDRKFC